MSDIAARPRSLSLSPFIASFHYHESDLAAVMDRTPTHWPGTPDGQFGIGRGSLSIVRSHHHGNDLWLRFLLSCTQACREASDSDLLTSWLAPWSFSPGLSDTSRGVRSVHRWRLQLHVWLECGGVVNGGSCPSKCPLAVTGPLSCSSAPLCSVPRSECPARVSDTVQRLCA